MGTTLNYDDLEFDQREEQFHQSSAKTPDVLVTAVIRYTKKVYMYTCNKSCPALFPFTTSPFHILWYCISSPAGLYVSVVVTFPAGCENDAVGEFRGQQSSNVHSTNSMERGETPSWPMAHSQQSTFLVRGRPKHWVLEVPRQSRRSHTSVATICSACSGQLMYTDV